MEQFPFPIQFSPDPTKQVLPTAARAPTILDLLPGLATTLGLPQSGTPSVTPLSAATKSLFTPAFMRSFGGTGAPVPTLGVPAATQSLPAPAALPSPATLNVPRISSGVVGQAVPRTLEFPAGPELPAPPLLPDPPQQTARGGVDFSEANKFLDQAKPGEIDSKSLNTAHLAGILAGAAEGAGRVDATEAGSFAKALALAGAGAARGAETSAGRFFQANTRKAERTEDFFVKRADAAAQQARARAAAAAAASEVAFKNAQALYQNQVANQAAQYEFQLKKLGMEQPQIKHDANGVSITTLNPQTRQFELKFTPTRSVAEQFEKMKPMFEAFNVPGPVARAAEAQAIATSLPAPLAQAEYQRRAVEEVIEKGAGPQVFGKAYEQAVKNATTALQKKSPTLVAKSELYNAELNKHIAAEVLNIPQLSTTSTWLQKAKTFSFFASILAGEQK